MLERVLLWLWRGVMMVGVGYMLWLVLPADTRAGMASWFDALRARAVALLE